MRQNTAFRRASSAVVFLLLVCVGCGNSVDVSTRSIREAKRTWDESNIRDYDLEWRSTGDQPGHYLVYVRQGKVREVRRILETKREIQANNGRNVIEAHPGDPTLYSVEGLFRILEQELDEAQSETPFGTRKEARVLLKFTPDDDLGYPRSYRRDVTGARSSLALDVMKLDTHPKAEIPPLPAR